MVAKSISKNYVAMFNIDNSKLVLIGIYCLSRSILWNIAISQSL